MRWLDGMSLSKIREMVKGGEPGVLQFMGSQTVRHDLASEEQQCNHYSY